MKKAKMIFWTLILFLSIGLLSSQWSLRTDPLIFSKQVISLKGSWQRHHQTYTTVLPANIKDNNVLEIISLTDAFTVEVAGQEIYHSPGTNAATAAIWIRLPSQAGGKTLSVIDHGRSRDLRKQLNNTAYIGTVGSLQYRMFMNNLYAMLFFLFTVIVTLAIAYIDLHARYRRSETKGLNTALHLAGFIFCSGVWILTDAQVLQLVTTRAGSVAMLSCIAFFMMPIFFLRFVDKILPGQKSFQVMELLFIINLMMAIVLQLTGLFSIYRYVILEHLMILVMVIIVVIAISSKGSLKQNKIRFGCILYFMCYITGLLLYYINPYNRLYAMTICLGVLLLSLKCIAAWYDQYLDEFEAIAQNQMLEKMAYIDALTGLGNRSAFERDWQCLQKDNTAFIMFDINGLKQANDTYGHHIGDLLITSGAKLIQESFKALGQAYRIGGDEFVVIIKNSHEAAIKTCLQKFEQSMNKQKIIHDIPVSIAYGVAMADQEKDLEALYRVADERMYHKKQMQKEGMQ